MQTKLQRARRRLNVLARCPLDYHPRRLSQTSTAEVLGVSQQAISKSLRRAAPDDPEVGRIAALSGWTNLQPITPARVRARAHADTFYDTRVLSVALFQIYRKTKASQNQIWNPNMLLP